MATVKFKENKNNLVPINNQKNKKVIQPTTKPIPVIAKIQKKYNATSLIKLKNSLILLETQITKKNKVLTLFKESEFKKPKRKLQSTLANYRKILKAIDILMIVQHEECR